MVRIQMIHEPNRKSAHDTVSPMMNGPPLFTYHPSTVPRPASNAAHCVTPSSPVGVTSSSFFPKIGSRVARKYAALTGARRECTAGIMNGQSGPSAALRNAPSKSAWNAAVPCGKMLGVGYVFSRYSTMRSESAMYVPVAGSCSAGSV